MPIGGGGLISGMAVAAKALKPDIEVIGVQATLYPSMYNAIKGQSRPMRGDTLAEGIAVKAPGRITTDIIRRLVDDIVLVTEDQIERAVAMLNDHREELDWLAARLIEKETVDGKVVLEVLHDKKQLVPRASASGPAGPGPATPGAAARTARTAGPPRPPRRWTGRAPTWSWPRS